MALLRLPAVKQRLGHRSDTTPYNDIRAGLLTKPVKIGARASAWPDDEIDAIAAARIAGRSDDEVRALVQRLHARRAERFAALEAA